MATSTDLTTSFNNTPQAVDDYYTAAQTGLLEDSTQTIYLAVMANDLGGKAKTLYSLDDGIENEDSASSPDLLVKDIVGVENLSQYGATIAIGADGTVAYTMTDASRAHFNSLSAGEIGYDSFTYAIRLGNGTLSWATATVEISGVNDAPVVTNAATELVGTVQEDATLAVSGQLSASDVDNGSSLTWSVQGPNDGSYGTIAVDGNGQWTYSLANDSAAVQALAAGESHDETFTLRVADEHGAFVDQIVTITINGTNDAAIISGDVSGAVAEDAVPNTASGTLSASDVDNDDNVFQANSGDGDNGYGSFEVDSAGNWTYSLDNGNPDVDALNVGDSLSDSFTVLSEDGTAQLVSITINGSNDAAVLSADVANLDETNDAADISTSGTLTISDVDSAETFQAQTDTAGSYGKFSIDSAGAWSYVADSAHNEFVDGTTYTDTFSVFSADGTETSVTINILGSNDAAVLSADVANLDETNDAADISTSGTLTISDVDSAETFQAQTDTAGSYGKFSIDSAGAWSYVADSAHNEFVDGTTYTDTFSVFSADGTETSVTINILGSNDAAELSSASVELDETNAPLSTNGQLSISDVDSPETFVEQSNTAGSYGSFSIDAAGVWSYTANSAFNELNVGDSLIDTFSVFSTDGTATSVSVTITGSNDAAVLSSASVELEETDAPLSTNGQLTISDVDSPATFQAQSGTLGDHGSFSIDAAGAWSYTANSAFDELNVGDSLTDTFEVLSADGTATSVSVTITGSNDTAAISGVSTGSVQEDTNIVGGQLTTSGTLTISDADAGQSSFQAQPAVAGTYGTFTLTTTGNWTYSVSNSLAAIQALNSGQSLIDSFTAVSLDGSASQLVEVSIHGLNDVTALTGTTASNTFSFSAAASGVYTITDPGGNGDKIDITGANTELTTLNFERAGNDLLIDINDQQITVLNHFGASANAVETITFAAGQSYFGYALEGDYSIFSGSGFVAGNGSSNDVIAGTSTDQTLNGGGGASGRDLLFGNAGNDTLIGQNGNDLLVGGAGNDLLRGEAGLDTLLGGDGDDILIGGLGNDTLIGGTGADSFVFAATGAPNLDQVLDYSFAEGDKLDLSALLDANFVSGSQVSDFVKLVQTGTDITVQVDVNGAAGGASFADVAVLTNYGTTGSDLVRTWFGDADQTLTV
ncbi:Poly(beta-D-mannuronate) C5 epimerase 1 [compost metagenome]